MAPNPLHSYFAKPKRPSLRIRRQEAADDAVVALMAENADLDSRAFRPKANQRKAIHAVVCADDLIMGALAARVEGKTVYLLGLVVIPGKRRQRVGSLLLDWLKKGYGDHDQRIVADVGERNLPAQLFLRANGFLAVEVLPRHRGETDDCWRMIFAAGGRVESRIARRRPATIRRESAA